MSVVSGQFQQQTYSNMKRETLKTRTSLHLTSSFSQDADESVLRKKKRIVLSVRKDKEQSESVETMTDNKENFQVNTSITLTSRKGPTQPHQLQTPFYLESSICEEEPFSRIKQQYTHMQLLIRQIESYAERTIQGVKTIKRALIRRPFIHLTKLVQRQPRCLVDPNKLQRMQNVLTRWGLRFALGGLRRGIEHISRKEIHTAIQIIKSKDSELINLSKDLAVRKLGLSLGRVEENILLQVMYALKTARSKQSPRNHCKQYSFSTST